MTTDATLPLGLFVPPAPDPKLTIDERFAAFHAVNPWVFDALEQLTTQWLASGHQRVGIAMLFEVLRWEHGRSTTGDQGFALNNDLRSRYARALIEAHPSWADVFATRALKAA